MIDHCYSIIIDVISPLCVLEIANNRRCTYVDLLYSFKQLICEYFINTQPTSADHYCVIYIIMMYVYCSPNIMFSYPLYCFVYKYINDIDKITHALLLHNVCCSIVYLLKIILDISVFEYFKLLIFKKNNE